MTSDKFLWRFIVQASILVVAISAAVLLVEAHYYYTLLASVPVVLYFWIRLYRYHTQTLREVDNFSESVRYHDFSRHFNDSVSAGEWRPMRRSFNEVFDVIKNISREREKHYQYLHKILELVDTGILSFDTATGEVVWINESLKRLLRLPNIKTLDTLSRKYPTLHEDIIRMEPGKQTLGAFDFERSLVKILLAATLFEIDGRTYKVIAIQNVQDALDQTESKAWQKLLSVLTHEIMNSVAPISSVAKTLNDLMMEHEKEQHEHLPVEDIRTGLATIKRRSEGLLRFSETYRNLSKITSLHTESIAVSQLFDGILLLMRPGMQQKKITLTTQLDGNGLRLHADPDLVEQVLINLVLNAIEAVKDRSDAKILLSAGHDENRRVQLSVSDNGTGIPAALLDTIFIPFFSTRKNGTGIGLSLSKQIMLLHNGSLTVRSVEGAGTSFICSFPDDI